MGKSIGRITFLMQPFLARKFKNLLQYRATNSKVPNETFFDSFETLWDCTYNFWRLCPIHSFKVLSLSQDYPVQSQSVSKTSFGILLFEARYGRKYLNFRAKNGCIKNVILPINLPILRLYFAILSNEMYWKLCPGHSFKVGSLRLGHPVYNIY